MTRVLKAGGEWVLVDVAARKYIPILEQNGFHILLEKRTTRLFFLPTCMLLAKKPVFS